MRSDKANSTKQRWSYTACAVPLNLMLMLALAGVSIAGKPYAADVTTGASWSKDERALIASMQWKNAAPPPHDPSNSVDDLPAARAFGERLFNDTRFSSNQAVACGSCHRPQAQFQDGLPVGHGVGVGTRRTMPLAGVASSAWFFWDGRKDSLWSQALGPLEDANEHGGTRTRYAQLIQTHYRREYEAVFGAMPALGPLPPEAGPKGSPAQQAAWAAMPVDAREQVSRIFANMGKAIAAYERSLTHHPSRFDRYAATLDEQTQGSSPLTEAEIKGLRIFIGKGQCVSCHAGPLLTDQSFHNTGVPPAGAPVADKGRAAGMAKVVDDEFNCLGHFSDANPEQCAELRFMAADDATMEGAFKTPSLRNVAERAPYMHAGQFQTLQAAIQHYIDAPSAAMGTSELGQRSHHGKGRQPIRLSSAEVSDLAAFLGALSDLPDGPIVATPAQP